MNDAQKEIVRAMLVKRIAGVKNSIRLGVEREDELRSELDATLKQLYADRTELGECEALLASLGEPVKTAAEHVAAAADWSHGCGRYGFIGT